MCSGYTEDWYEDGSNSFLTVQLTLCDLCFQALQDVTGDEFVAFMKILSGLKQTSTVLGRQQLVDIVAEQADLEKEFEVRSKLS